MKNSHKSIRSSLLLFSLLLTSPVWAKSVAVVKSMVGNAFVVKDQRTWQLKPGMEIPDFAEVLTEEGSEVTLSDYYDHYIHLAGSGHLKLMNQTYELKRGYVWIQSLKPHAGFSVLSANAYAKWGTGEAIFSFDPSKGKTQVLSINGNIEFGNSLDDFKKLEVKPGQFSFLDLDYKDGQPRLATPIGESSYQKITGLFQNVDPVVQHSVPYQTKRQAKRSIASVEDEKSQNEWSFEAAKDKTAAKKDVKAQEPTKKSSDEGKFIIIRRAPAVVRGPSSITPKSIYKKELKKLKQRKLKRDPRDYSKPSSVPIRIFGKTTSLIKKGKSTPSAPAKPKQAKRMPASVTKPVMNHYKSPKGQMYKDFSSSMVDKYKKQMRHNTEVNSLINDLESVDMDYDKKY